MGFFLKIQTKGALPNSSCKASIFLIPMSGKDTTKLQTDIPYKHRYKNPQWNTSTLNKNPCLQNHFPWQSWLNPGITVLVQHTWQ